MIVENVRGAQPWVGRARWNYGSFYLWGDVPALMPFSKRQAKVPGLNWKVGSATYDGRAFNDTAIAQLGLKHDGSGWTDKGSLASHNRLVANTFGWNKNEEFQAARRKAAMKDDEAGLKMGGDWFSDPTSTCRRHGSKSKARKAASAMIAKIPLPLSTHLARTFKP